MSKQQFAPDLDPSWYDDVEWDELEMTPMEVAQASLDRIGAQLDESMRNDARSAASRLHAIELFRREWESSSIDLATSASISARAMRAELAARMTVSERVMESMIGYARVLVNDLPRTLAALFDGQMTERHARTIVDESADLAAAERARMEAELIPLAEQLTVPKFARKARTFRELIQACTIDERRDEAQARREVSFSPARDGMGWLTAYLPAEQMLAISSKLTRIATAVQDPDRTDAQIKADAFSDLLLDEGALLPPVGDETALRAPTQHRGIRPDVHVTVPVMTLLGQGEVPAELDGYGPIGTEAAKQLAGAATGWFRILTHPETGIHLSYGRDRYEVPADLKRYLRARDETCRFIGCNRAASACEIDHTTAWKDGGETAAHNLGCLCKGHHTLKHNSAWQVVQVGDGDIESVSPTGRRYRTSPARRIGAGTEAQTEWLSDQADPPPF